MSALLPSEVLASAADLIEPEGCWTTGHGARTADGELTAPHSPAAVCWCLHGAMIAVDPGYDRDCEEFVARALDLRDITDAYDWNDAPGRTQAQVVAALRKASELAKAEGQ